LVCQRFDLVHARADPARTRTMLLIRLAMIGSARSAHVVDVLGIGGRRPVAPVSSAPIRLASVAKTLCEAAG
jgi:hypothetical protein